MLETVLRIRVRALTPAAFDAVKQCVADSLVTVNNDGIKAIADMLPDTGEFLPPMAPSAALTPTEQRVAAGLARGLRSKQIAVEMNIADGTVKTHIRNAMRKTGTTTRTQLALTAAQGVVA